MKRLIFILVLFLNGIVSSGQIKPTKLETIDWIRDKIRTCQSYTTITKRYNEKPHTKTTAMIDENGDIEVSLLIDVDEYGAPDTRARYIITFDNICSASIEEILGHNAVSITFKKHVKIISDDRNAVVSLSVGLICLNEKKELNINSRLVNALNNLGAYNCPPVKEVF